MVQICAKDGENNQILVMGMDTEDNGIYITSKKKKSYGRKIDNSHDIEYLEEVPPYLLPEILDRNSMDDTMSPELTSFINAMWEMAAEEDPWYMTVLETEAELAEA